jgi:serine protease inhibitor
LQTHPLQPDSGYQNKKLIQVNLSLPKFDISADLDLRDVLEGIGITDIFNANNADFTPILPQDDGGYIDEVKHAARVAIDEKGITAAAFTLILRYGAGSPPEDKMDFVLDRPFLFIVESEDGLPLFTGTVMEP